MQFNLVFGWLRIHFLVRVIKFQETGGSRNLDSTISYFQKDGTVFFFNTFVVTKLQVIFLSSKDIQLCTAKSLFWSD